MPKQLTKLDFTGQTIYAGIDVGKKSWSVSIRTELLEHKTFSQRPNAEDLVTYLRRNFPNADYRCAYEAGYSGFWPHHDLTELGVECIVVHPTDVPTKDKERRHRDDRVDSRKLARGLRNGELEGIYIPDRIAQENRGLVRARHMTVTKQTRCKNQIRGLLSYYGFTPPETINAAHWSNYFIRWLETIPFETANGRQTLDLLLRELAFLREQIAALTRQIRALSEREPYQSQVMVLRTIPGISVLAAMILLTELVDMTRFKDLDHLASYVGLVPGSDSSGSKEVDTGLTNRRNPFLRHLLIESSWVAVRKDPALLLCFAELNKRMVKPKAIVHIARKLLSRIRFVLKNQQPYVTGVVE
jgi:transposase